MNCYCYCYLINSFKNFKELRTLVSRAIRAIRVEKSTLLRRRNPPWQFDLSVEDFTPLRGRIHPRKVEAFTLFGGKKHPRPDFAKARRVLPYPLQRIEARSNIASRPFHAGIDLKGGRIHPIGR